MTPPAASRSRAKPAPQVEDTSPDEVLGPSGTDPGAAQPPMIPTTPPGEAAVPPVSGTSTVATPGVPAGIVVEHEEVTPAGVKAPEIADGQVVVRLRHKRGCPKDRTESYPQDRPASVGGGKVTVVRCCDCGESDVVGDLQAYDDDDHTHIISGG